MDKYTKGILTVIAVGIIGVNIQLLNTGSGFFTKANAMNTNITKVQICDITTCSSLSWDGKLKVTTD